jgi:hypothetical protein
MSAHLVQMFDSTFVRAHVWAVGAKGAGQSSARSLARRLSTTIHLETDFDGLPIPFHLSRRARRSPTRASTPKTTGRARTRHLTGHSAPQDDRRQAELFSKVLYTGRARIEQAVGKIKRFKRIALRCAKTARNFRSLLAPTCAFILIKSVHTA